MILFRADGNNIVGTGHIMRCLSIADAFRRRGENSVFVIADDFAKEMIVSRGYETVTLGTRYDSLEDEIEIMRSLIHGRNPSYVILDTYFVTKEYMNALDPICKLVYIDDLAVFPYPCSVLVNYNAYGPDLDYEGLYGRSSTKKPRQYLGVGYAPLREDFRDVEAHAQPERVLNVLVSTGGADPKHIAVKMIRALLDSGIKYKYHFLVGSMNEDVDEISALSENSPDIILHRNVRDMKALLMECDIAVSAAGSTLYELCACGVPTITYVFADNQIMGAEAFQKLDLMKSIGDIREICDYEKILLKEIDRLATDHPLRKEISERMQRMIDGYGADRLAAELGIELGTVTIELGTVTKNTCNL